MSRDKYSDWAIGIYEGASPTALRSARGVLNPVLRAQDVTDCDAIFVADPFMVFDAGMWHMYFEVLDRTSGKGRIGHASSPDGRAWTYGGIALAEPFHLSYPFLFRHEDQWWMLPETLENRSLRLYRAEALPGPWRLEFVAAEGEFADGTLLQRDEKWFLFSTTGHHRGAKLHLHVADDLFGPWSKHPASPVRQKPQKAVRPGGRIVEHEGRTILFTQDGRMRYGHSLRAYEIEELSATTYREKRLGWRSVLGASGFGWNRHGMHHMDAYRRDDGSWIACVDGFRRVRLGRAT